MSIVHQPRPVAASSLKVGDAIYGQIDGSEYKIKSIEHVGLKLRIHAASDFLFCQPAPLLVRPEGLVMALPQEAQNA
jgi:hypothetical protein